MRIMLDPGHGGSDPGAVTPEYGIREADINREVCGILAAILRDRGHDVVMTRYGDEYVSIRDRADLANESAADIMLSIHCNAHENPSAHGAEALFFPGSKRGELLANTVLKGWVAKAAIYSRGVKPRRDLGVLRRTHMPAALLELGFIGNEHDLALYLEARTNMQQAHELVAGIANGVDSYWATLRLWGEDV